MDHPKVVHNQVAAPGRAGTAPEGDRTEAERAEAARAGGGPVGTGPVGAGPEGGRTGRNPHRLHPIGRDPKPPVGAPAAHQVPVPAEPPAAGFRAEAVVAPRRAVIVVVVELVAAVPVEPFPAAPERAVGAVPDRAAARHRPHPTGAANSPGLLSRYPRPQRRQRLPPGPAPPPAPGSHPTAYAMRSPQQTRVPYNLRTFPRGPSPSPCSPHRPPRPANR